MKNKRMKIARLEMDMKQEDLAKAEENKQKEKETIYFP